ncbi:MAG: Flp family type IVb pilin [Myxococcota bacterium]|jgi:pilus assembly protein Flp/PilA|nr:Flp family type IVb pilin [Myxococcota bacterium]
MTTLNRLIRDERGSTVIEYGLIAGLVAVALIAALTLLGGSLEGLLDTISGTIIEATMGS